MFFFIAASDNQPFVESSGKCEPNLYLYEDELDERPHIKTFIDSMTNYQNTIPPATDPDAKPPPPSARMGKCSELSQIIIMQYRKLT